MITMFRRLFEPFNIGNVRVRNRICLPPMVVGLATSYGEVTEALIAYYERRSYGGVGLVDVEASYVREDGRLAYGELGIYSDDLIPGLARLAERIKVYGASASVELVHGGIQSKVPKPLGPSVVGRKYVKLTGIPRELSTEEVAELVDAFGRAALRAKQAGFDMVDIHGTHGYLIAQFLSPLTNRRTDKYGADRALFAIEVVKRVKEYCGSSYPVIFRLCADEFVDGGITLEYAKEVAIKLVKEAGVDAFNVTGGNADSGDYIVPPRYYSASEGWFFRLAYEIKKVVDVPVISGGLITDPRVAEDAISKGLVDAVFVGRQLIADPDWPKKVYEGRLDDIRVCQACNDGCIGRIFSNKPVWCAINSLTGFEHKWFTEEEIPKASKVKKVLVVGAGPAGLETARIAALRGHEVILVEEELEVGGTARIAARPKFKERLNKLIGWYVKQLSRLGVKVVTGVRVTPEVVKELNPDTIVLATGSKPLIPNISGVENALIADEVLLKELNVGKKVVVVGGGLVGIEVALHLAMNGREVTIVEALPEIAMDLDLRSKLALIKPQGLIEKLGIKVLTNAAVIDIGKNYVTLLIPPTKRLTINADTIVLAVGRKSNVEDELLKYALDMGKEAYLIGDAKQVRKLIDAIHEGFFTALNI